ncbi:hypothetical protein BofuT4_uP099460.1 [Botrytis cinerea T4]|uniref:Uncharacterized protein n=1 Tax=Botryotinia fuckeliana (strain T4) TaxID=999810 RepID=G2YC66_BOTF4|nr:hypothetical protein BofuT4_uP099460.1 [Botrytis cinerea T4]
MPKDVMGSKALFRDISDIPAISPVTTTTHNGTEESSRQVRIEGWI